MVLPVLHERAGRSLLLTRLTKKSMALDSYRSELLRKYGKLKNFLLRVYAADELIAEAYNDVVNFLQSSAVTKGTYFVVL